MQGYGQGRIFRDRFNILIKSAKRYFIKSPNQELEGELCFLLQRVLGFSDRRNEVAHGIIFQLQRMKFFKNTMDDDEIGRAHV